MEKLMFNSGEGRTLKQLRLEPEPVRHGKYHQPIHHARFIDTSREAAQHVGLVLVNLALALSCKGKSLFWAADVEVSSRSPLYGLLADRGNYTLVGRKDDMHKRAVEVWGGEKAWICSNLQIQGDNLICKKKQTSGLSLIDEMVAGFQRFEAQALETRRLNVEAEKALITDNEAKVVIYNAVADKVVNLNGLREVGKNYFRPESGWEDCHPRSRGGLLGAFTRYLRDQTPERKISGTTIMCGRLLKPLPETALQLVG